MWVFKERGTSRPRRGAGANFGKSYYKNESGQHVPQESQDTGCELIAKDLDCTAFTNPAASTLRRTEVTREPFLFRTAEYTGPMANSLRSNCTPKNTEEKQYAYLYFSGGMSGLQTVALMAPGILHSPEHLIAHAER